MTVMKNLKWTAVLALAIALGISSPAWSHHSHAMFDHDKEVTIRGTVTDWVFRNPHVFLYVNVKTDGGETVKYDIDTGRLDGGGDGKRVQLRILPKSASTN